MSMNNPTLEWDQPAWQAKARAWILASLERNDLKARGEIEPIHNRPWSVIWRVPTENEIFYFKASAHYLKQEAAVTQYLTSFRPALFPGLLNADTGRGWLLMEDAGIPLRQYVREEKSFARWKGIMPLFVQLQKDLVPHAAELLALGIMDRRLDRLPELFESLISDEAAMLIGHELGLSSQEYERLKKMAPEFRRMCMDLKDLGIPESIHHDDFHDANIFLRDGRVRFTDWGESAITHPFLSLVVMLRGAGNSLEAFKGDGIEAGPDTPEIAALRNLYLEEWTSAAPLKELQAMARIAERKIGYVNRALTWHYVNSHLPQPLSPEDAMAVPSYLKEFLES